MPKQRVARTEDARKQIASGDGLLVALGKIAGIGGISVGAFLLLFRSFLTQQFISNLKLDPGQGYHLLLLFMLFTFGVATVGLTVWASQREAGRRLTIALLIFALLLAGLGAYLISADMKSSGTNDVPRVRQGKLGTFIARLSPHSNTDHQLQLEGVGLPENSTILVQVWKNGKEVREPRGNVERSDSGEWRYEWITVDEGGEYVIEVQRTGEGASSQLPQQFVIGVGANFASEGSSTPKAKEAEPLSTLAHNAMVLINLPEVRQEQSMWDGPAAMMALGRYYGRGPSSQLDWAQALNGTTADIPTSIQRVVEVSQTIGLDGTLISSPLSEQQVKSNIDSGNVILCFITWANGGGHFVLISGYGGKGSSDTYFQVMDPTYGLQLYPESQLLIAYQGVGHWAYSAIFKP